MDLKEQNILGKKVSSHWYYRSKAKAISRFLSGKKISTILDVGAGSGYFSRHLLANGMAKDAWCVDISYESNYDLYEKGSAIHFRRSVEELNADVVLLMDVLEHVDDDVALLKDYVAKVPKGTLFLISVPAFDFLWSEHDVYLEHKRRYSLKQIERVVERANLTVKQGSYYFGAVFPIAATFRILGRRLRKRTAPPKSQLKQHNPIVNEILAAASFAELPFMTHNRLGGLTAFCLAVS